MRNVIKKHDSRQLFKNIGTLTLKIVQARIENKRSYLFTETCF